MFLSAFAVLVLAACTPNVNTGGLTEEQIRTIVQEEMTNTTPGDGESVVVDENMSDDDFQSRVEAAIETYIAKQEEEARQAAEEASRPQQVAGVSVDDDPVQGAEDAPVTIIEFSDFECPFCARHFTTVYPQIKENYIDTGKVKYVFRDFPLGFHQNAYPAAVAANCALAQGGDEVYFEYHDKLFENQQGLNREAYVQYANELELNEGEFTACLDADDRSEIDNDLAEGQSYGVEGTPGFFINGWSLKGAYPYEAFEELIEQELAAAESGDES